MYAGSIPPDALLANASEIVPVGAIDSSACCESVRAISLLTGAGRREAQCGAARYFRVEQRKRAFFLRELYRRFIR